MTAREARCLPAMVFGGVSLTGSRCRQLVLESVLASGEKPHQRRVHLVGVRPEHAMWSARKLDQLDVLDHLGLPPRRGIGRQDAVGVAVRIPALMPAKTLGSTPSGLSAALTRYGPSVPIRTALRTRLLPYFPRYRVTSPEPIEKPTRSTFVRSSVVRTVLRSAANVS